jgi:hypothetical protein
MKKHIKQDIRDFMMAFCGGLLSITFALIVFGFANVSYLKEQMYSLRENLVTEDLTVDLIAKRCNYEETEQHKIYCVYNIVTSFYRYKEHDDLKYYYPTDTLISGGVCRDVALTYCAIFRQLNITCKYHANNEHIFNIVDKQDGSYCIIDQNILECV